MSYTDQSTNQGLRNTGKKSKPDIAEALSEKNLDREKSVQRGLESGIKAPKAKTSAARRPGKQAGKDPRDRAAREYGSKSQKNASCSAASRSENETRDKEYEERDLLGSGHNNFANAEVELMRRLELRDDGPAGYRSRNTLNPRKLLLGSQDLNLDDEKKPSFPVMSYSDHSNIQDSDSQISFYRCEHFDSSYSYNGYYNCSICSHWAGEMSYAHLLQNDILITQQHQFMSPKFTFRNVENIPPLVVGVFGRKKFEKLAIITQLSTSPHIIPSRKRSLQSACTVDMYVTPDSFVFLDVPVTRDSESGGEKFTSGKFYFQKFCRVKNLPI